MSMYDIKELVEQRGQAIKNQQAYAVKRHEEKREHFQAEELQAIDNLEAEIQTYDRKIETLQAEQKITDRMNANANGERSVALQEARPGSQRFTQKDLNDAFRYHMLRGRNGGSQYESAFRKVGLDKLMATDADGGLVIKYSDDFSKLRRNMQFGTSAQSSSTAGLGGDLVQTDIVNAVIISQAQYGNIANICRNVPTSGGNPMNFPCTTDYGNPSTIVGQNSQTANPTEIDFTYVQLNAFKTVTKVTVPTELIEDAVVNVPALVGELIGERVNRGRETYLATGTGSGQPTGIVGTASPLPTYTTAHEAQITYADLVGAYHTVNPVFRGRPDFAWMLHDTLIKQARLIVDTTGKPMWMPTLTTGFTLEFKDTLFGKPVLTNNYFPTVALNSLSGVVGDFRYWGFRRVNEIRILVNPWENMSYDQTTFYAFERLDCNLLYDSNASSQPLVAIKMAAAT